MPSTQLARRARLRSRALMEPLSASVQTLQGLSPAVLWCLGQMWGKRCSKVLSSARFEPSTIQGRRIPEFRRIFRVYLMYLGSVHRRTRSLSPLDLRAPRARSGRLSSRTAKRGRAAWSEHLVCV